MGTVVLAFSGGLDTSFCIPYLREKGHDVITMFVDTGGVSAEQRTEIEARAKKLGAKEHVNADGAKEVWDEVVVPLVIGGELYQNQYPLLVSDRYVIVKRAIELANAKKTKLFAHGCTGMGNDQVRFDLSVRALGDYTILAPIRDIQAEHKNVREYERQYLEKIGYSVPAKQTVYTINENLLGVTMSGSEIDEWKAPGPETYQLTPPPAKLPREATRVAITFEQGVAVAVDGRKMDGPAILRDLNTRLGAHGVGRGIYTGDTTIGLKGRIIFEAAGPALGMVERYLFFSSSVVAAMIFCVLARTEFSYSSMMERISAARGEGASCAAAGTSESRSKTRCLMGNQQERRRERLASTGSAATRHSSRLPGSGTIMKEEWTLS